MSRGKENKKLVHKCYSYVQSVGQYWNSLVLLYVNCEPLDFFNSSATDFSSLIRLHPTSTFHANALVIRPTVS